MGHQQREGDPAFGLCPPACLEKLNEAKDGEEIEAALEGLRAEARQVQIRLKEQLGQFRTEVDIFLRLMYKNKNQHRHGLYYRRLLQVRRDLRLLDYSELDKTVEGFTRWTFPFKQSRANVDRRALEKENHVSSALCTILSAVRILNQIDEPILLASSQMLGLLSQSFFMSLGLTIFATLARLRLLSVQLLFELANVYNLLSVLSKEEQEVPNPTAQLRLAPVEASRHRLPLHLECHWDAGKLSVTEIEPPPQVAQAVPLATPLSNGLWFVDDRKSAAVPKDIEAASPFSNGSWFVDDRKSLAVPKDIVAGLNFVGVKTSTAGDSLFVDDRTRVKYDVCMSAVTAREEPLETPETTGQQFSVPPEAGTPMKSHKGEPALRDSVPGEVAHLNSVIEMKDEGSETVHSLGSACPKDLSENHIAPSASHSGDPNLRPSSEVGKINEDATTALKDGERSISSCEDTAVRDADKFLDQVGSSKEVLSDNLVLKSSLESIERKHATIKASASLPELKRRVAYISILTGPKTEVKRQEDDIPRAQVIEPGVATLDPLAEIPAMMTQYGDMGTAAESNGVCGLQLGAKRPVAQISTSAPFVEREENSGQEVSVPEMKPGDSKVPVSKKKKRRPKIGDGKERQLGTKQDSPKKKEETNDKMPKKKEVGDLFNMLLGGL